MIMQLGLGLGLTHVQQAGGGEEPVILESIDFAGNTEITNTDEYSNVTEVTTYIDFNNCPALVSANFSVLQTVGGYVKFNDSTALTSSSFPELETVGEHIRFDADVELTTVQFPSLTTVGEGISFADCALLTSVNLGALQSFGSGNALNFNSSGVVDVTLTALTQGGEINFQNCADLESVSCPALTTLAAQMGFQSSTVLASINFPLLEEVVGNLSFNNNALLATVAFPALTTVGQSLSLGTLDGLTTLDLSELVSIGAEPFVGGFSLTANSLEELSLPSLEITFNGINVQSGTLLADVNISALLNCGSNVYFNNCGLSEASVDAILTKMASLDGTNGTTLFENLEVSVGGGTSAPPSATGLTAKATLEGRGCTVTVN